MPIKQADVGRIPMRWEEHGDGPAVIFLHGLPTSPMLWRHVLPEMTDVRAIAWEMVGYGGSMEASKGRDISVARQAEYLVAWMGAVGIEQAVLVGHDLGGGVAQIAAVRNTDRVRGLVLTDSICYDAWPLPSVRFLQALAPLVARLPEPLLAPVFALLCFRGHETAEQAREAFRLHFRRYRHPDGAEAFVRQILSLHTRDTLEIADDLPKLRLPARVVWGAADPFLPVSYGERLARDLKAPLDCVEGGKHFVPEDRPHRVASAVREVLAQG